MCRTGSELALLSSALVAVIGCRTPGYLVKVEAD